MTLLQFDAAARARGAVKRLTMWAVVCVTTVSARLAFADDRVTLDVWPLSVYEDSEGHYHGQCQPLVVTMVRNLPGAVRVGFYESEVGGSGPQWKSAGWTAVMTAAQLLDFDRRIGEVSFDIQGRIDGPSAGALMTVGVLAAARGDHIRPDATMTGTINPDGIIGPVGGIPHKIEGAAKAGKKLVLIPAGIALQTNKNTGHADDLVTLGHGLGVEVVPALDIFTAYQQLTGVELPRGSAHPLGPIDSIASNAIAAITHDWLARVAKVWKTWDDHPELSFFTPEREALRKEASALYQSGANLIDEGEYSASLHDALQGIRGHYLVQEADRCEQVYRKSGEAAMIARIRDNNWLAQAVEDASRTLAAFTPQNLNQLGMYLEAMDSFLVGISYRAMAATMLDRLSATSPAKRAAAARSASYCQIRGWFMLKLAEDYAKAAARLEGPAISKPVAIAELADFYRRAADANLSAFTSLAVDPVAQKQGISTLQAEFLLRLKDEEFGLIREGAAQFPSAIQRAFPAGLQRNCAELAASVYTYCRGAMLVAKYYSLDAELDSHLQVVRLARERTFGDWLAASEDETLRGIGRLHERGIESFTCRYAYETAHVIEGRGLGSRLEALHLLFRASVASRVLWHLSDSIPAPAAETAATPAAAPLAAGMWRRVGQPGDWKATIAGATQQGQLYTAESSGNLYVSDLTSGAWHKVGDRYFGDAWYMFSSGETLYEISATGTLYRIDAKSGDYQYVGEVYAFNKVLAMAVQGNTLYTAESSGALVKCDLSSGQREPIGKAEFGDTVLLFCIGESLYSIEKSGTLYRISPADGSWQLIASVRQRPDLIAGVAHGNKIYVITREGVLSAIDPATGDELVLGLPDFANTRFLFAGQDGLYTIEQSGSLYYISTGEPGPPAVNPTPTPMPEKTRSAAPRYVMEVVSKKRIRATYRFEVTTKEVPATEMVSPPPPCPSWTISRRCRPK